MRGREEHLDKKFAGVIKKYLALAQIPVEEVVSLERDYVTFLLERHNSEVVKRECHSKKFFRIF